MARGTVPQEDRSEGMSLEALVASCQATIQKIEDAQAQISAAREAIGSAREMAMMTLSADSIASETASMVQARLGEESNGAQNNMDEGNRMCEAAKEILESFIARLMG